MKVFLINPRCEESWFQFHPDEGTYTFKTNGTTPPLGLLYISTVLRKNGHEVRLIDNDSSELSIEEILLRIEKFRPGVVGFSILTGSSKNAHRNGKKIKEVFPDIKILYGGPLATNFPRKLLERHCFVDFLLRGEADFTTLELIDKLEEGKPVGDIEGIAYRENGSIKVNEGIPEVKGLDKLPFPDRSLLSHEYNLSFPLGYHEVRLSIGKFTSILTSRGCPNNCRFCLEEKKGWNGRSPTDVVDELEYLYDKGYRHIYFMDSDFAADVERAKKICRLIRRRGLHFYWCAELSAENSQYSLFKEMKEAGCEGVLMGMESGCRDVLSHYNKPLTPEISKEAAKNARKAGISVVIGSFIIGGPKETEEKIRETIRFSKSLDLDAVMLSKLVVKPRSSLWKEMVEKNYLTEELIDNHLETPIHFHELNNEFSSEKLDKMIEKGYKSFLWRPKFLINTFYRSIRYRFRRKWLSKNFYGILLLIKEKFKEKIIKRND